MVSVRTSPNYTIHVVKTKIKIRMLGLFVVTFFLLLQQVNQALSGYILELNQPLKSLTGVDFDIEKIRKKIRNIEEHSNANSLDDILSAPFITNKIYEKIYYSCNKMDFPNGAHELFDVKNDKKDMINCVNDVFIFSRDNLYYPAPNLKERFSEKYISESLELGYQCGYRTRKHFASYALVVWLVNASELKSHERFTCDPDEAKSNIFFYDFGANRISDRILSWSLVFENWDDIQLYRTFYNLVLYNRRKEACLGLYLHPFDDLELNEQLKIENSCNEFKFRRER